MSVQMKGSKIHIFQYIAEITICGFNSRCSLEPKTKKTCEQEFYVKCAEACSTSCLKVNII